MRAPRRLWPDPHQTLLLHAALAPAPAAARAWSALTGAVSQQDLNTWLKTCDQGSRRLLPLVYRNLTQHGVADARVASLAAHYEQAHDRNVSFLRHAGDVLGALDKASIPTMTLKGGALVGRIYDGLGERPVSDLDVLVPPSRLADAAGVLRALGFQPQAPMTDAAIRYTHAIEWKRDGAIPVDLHWHVYEECCRPGDDDFWAASTAERVGGAPTRIPAVADQLVHACAHGEKWVHVPGFRWVADAVTILRRCTVNWDRVLEQAVARRFALRLRAQFAYLVEEFDAPIPPGVLAALADVRAGALERFEHRFGVRDRRRPWMLVYACNHLRASDGGVLATALTFPRYLQAIWRLESLAQVPGAGLAKVLRRSPGRASFAPAE